MTALFTILKITHSIVDRCNSYPKASLKKDEYSRDKNPRGQYEVNTIIVDVEAKASEPLVKSVVLMMRRGLKISIISDNMIGNFTPTDPLHQAEVVPGRVCPLFARPGVEAQGGRPLGQGQQTGGQADVYIVRGQGAALHRGQLGGAEPELEHEDHEAEEHQGGGGGQGGQEAGGQERQTGDQEQGREQEAGVVTREPPQAHSGHNPAIVG